MQAHTDVAEALDRLRELAAVRRPDDAVLGQFLALYYSELPEEDVDDRKIDDIYAVGVAHFDLGRSRRRGSPVVRVMSPDRERDGWSTPHSVVLMVTDDMPFLVDTMRMLLERHGLDIHLLVHPMLAVERDGDRRDAACRAVQRPRRQDGRRRAGRRGVDRRSRSTASTTTWRPTLEAELAAAVADVRRVVGDFGRDARTPARRWSTSTRRCSGSPTDSSCSSAPSTRRATSPAT